MGNQQSRTRISEDTAESGGKGFFVDYVGSEVTGLHSHIDCLVCFIDKSWSCTDILNKTLTDIGGNIYATRCCHLQQKHRNCQIGDTFIGYSGKLPFKAVFFSVMPNHPSEDQIGHYTSQVTMAIDNVIQKAVDAKLESIAFPVLTGEPCPLTSELLVIVYYKYLRLDDSLSLRHFHLLTFDEDIHGKVCKTLVDMQLRVLENDANYQTKENSNETYTGDYTGAKVDIATRVEYDPKTRVEDYPENQVEGSPGTGREDDPENQMEGGPDPENQVESSPGTGREDDPENQVEGSPDPENQVEGSPGTGREDVPENQVEGSPGTGREDYPENQVEGSPGTGREDYPENLVEGSPGTGREDGPENQVEGNPGTGREDDPELKGKGYPRTGVEGYFATQLKDDDWTKARDNSGTGKVDDLGPRKKVESVLHSLQPRNEMKKEGDFTQSRKSILDKNYTAISCLQGQGHTEDLYEALDTSSWVPGYHDSTCTSALVNDDCKDLGTPTIDSRSIFTCVPGSKEAISRAETHKHDDKSGCAIIDTNTKVKRLDDTTSDDDSPLDGATVHTVSSLPTNMPSFANSIMESNSVDLQDLSKTKHKNDEEDGSLVSDEEDGSLVSDEEDGSLVIDKDRDEEDNEVVDKNQINSTFTNDLRKMTGPTQLQQKQEALPDPFMSSEEIKPGNQTNDEQEIHNILRDGYYSSEKDDHDDYDDDMILKKDVQGYVSNPWKMFGSTETMNTSEKQKRVHFDPMTTVFSAEEISIDKGLDFMNIVLIPPTKAQQRKGTVGKAEIVRPPKEEATEDKSNSYFCAICQEEKPNAFQKKLQKCGHVFCKICIETHFKEKPVCPLCNESDNERIGNMPPGIMSYYIHDQTNLPGYEGHGIIVIEYDIPDGIQRAEHPNPGQTFKGCQRTAYLPNTDQGQIVLKMLQKAFDQKLTFTVGQSRTTGQNNVVTWNDIHHKTGLSGGPQKFGYPDPKYLDRLEKELRAMGIQPD